MTILFTNKLTTLECRTLCMLHNLKLATVAPDWSFMLTKQGESKADELIKKEGDHV